MPRMTTAELKAACNWSQVLNIAPADTRWLMYLNECLERFTHMAMWDRMVQRYQICVNQACITWPRQFMTLEAVDICNRPFPIRNSWYEYLENGPGKARIKNCFPYAVHDRRRGFVMFDDITTPSIIRLYPQFATDIGKTVTIRGYDSNGQWVLTDTGATVGEKIVLASPFVDSTTVWMRQVFREVIKEKTAGFVRAYSYDATLPVPPASPGPGDTPLTALALWEPSETIPDYRRSYIPYLASQKGSCKCEGSTSSCDKVTVTVEAKLAHIPVENDLDFLLVSNVSALKLGMLSVMLEERQDYQGAQRAMFGTFDPMRKKYVGGAVPYLEDELGSFQGDGVVVPLRLESANADRAFVENLI